MLLVVGVVLVLGLHLSGATKGIDVSQLVYPSDFKCLKEAGYDFVIVRAFLSLGEPDQNAIHTIANAREAEFRNIDVYMFPCPRCLKSASEQVDAMGTFIFRLLDSKLIFCCLKGCGSLTSGKHLLQLGSAYSIPLPNL